MSTAKLCVFTLHGCVQAITWIYADLLSISIKIHTFSLKELHLKKLYVKWQPFCLGLHVLTHWGRVTHICIGKLTNIGSDNGLAPGRRQAIIWTNAGILLIGLLGTNLSEILVEIHPCSFQKMHLKLLSAKRRPFCLGLNVLTCPTQVNWGNINNDLGINACKQTNKYIKYWLNLWVWHYSLDNCLLYGQATVY